jgi:hypothetical protein
MIIQWKKKPPKTKADKWKYNVEDSKALTIQTTAGPMEFKGQTVMATLPDGSTTTLYRLHPENELAEDAIKRTFGRNAQTCQFGSGKAPFYAALAAYWETVANK